MQNISKQSHYVRCPGTELLCSGLWGHWEEKLWRHSFRANI